MRKQTLFKKVISLAVAAAMAVSVCTAALADNDAAAQGGNGTSSVESSTGEKTPLQQLEAMIDELPEAEKVTNDNVKDVDAQVQLIIQFMSANADDILGLDEDRYDKFDAVYAKVEELKNAAPDEKPEVKDPVATIGDKKYASLADAFKAVDTAGMSAEIVLQKDVTDAPKLSAINGTTVTVNLNGHNITFADGAHFYVGGNNTLNLTGKGVVAESTAKYAPVYVTGNAEYKNRALAQSQTL